MDEDRRQRHWLAHELGEAASRGEMSLAFQPIADCASRRIIGQEALARWTHPVLGPISPDTFIALAEEHGLIADIGQYLLVEALTTARHWPMDWKLAINLSPVQLREPQLGEQMLATILAHGMDPVRVEVEVTEGVLIEQRETATANLRTLRAAGVQIVMDDFGTGYSSLSSLQQFPFDKIKIDRSFISAMDAHGPALSIVRASLGLGRSLNIPIVAEGSKPKPS
ncbi:EAL domain-containing protein [Sphingomonas sp. I4]